MALTRNILAHTMAFGMVVIWGITYIISKMLIEQGLSPMEIFFIRFFSAYICLLTFTFKLSFSRSIKDELLFFIIGVTGGSMYFLLENTALSITSPANVSLIICSSPLFTTLISSKITNGKNIKKKYWIGSAIAITGVFLIILNDGAIFKVNPLGDILVLLAAISWSIYSLLLNNIGGKYAFTFVLRKTFFYGTISVIPFLFQKNIFHISEITSYQLSTFIYLIALCIATLICYSMWNYAVKGIGAERACHYIYLTPITTLLLSLFVMKEGINMVTFVGAALVLWGVYLAEKYQTIPTL